MSENHISCLSLRSEVMGRVGVSLGCQRASLGSEFVPVSHAHLGKGRRQPGKPFPTCCSVRGDSRPHPNRCLTEQMRKGGHWAKTGGIRVRGQAWTGARGGGLRPSLQTPL